MKKRKFLILIAITFTVRSACGQVMVIYDQQSSTNTFLNGSLNRFNNYQAMGQSFTPSLNSVGFVQFQFADFNDNNLGATVYVNLREDSITGNILSATLPISMPDNFKGITKFLFPSPVTVTPGVTYYFQPVLQSGDDAFVILDGQYNYPGGGRFILGAPSPGDTDLWFREGIIVPKISIERTNGMPRIRFSTISNQNYSVEYSPDLNSTNWADLLGTNIQGTGQDVSLTDTNVTMSINRFYRLKLVP